jgi:hypothetical protein
MRDLGHRTEYRSQVIELEPEKVMACVRRMKSSMGNREEDIETGPEESGESENP